MLETSFCCYVSFPPSSYWCIRLMETCFEQALAHPSCGSMCFTGVGASVVWKHVLRAFAHPSHRNMCFTSFGASVLWKHVILLGLSHPSYGSTSVASFDASALWKHLFYGLWRIRQPLTHPCRKGTISDCALTSFPLCFHVLGRNGRFVDMYLIAAIFVVVARCS